MDFLSEFNELYIHLTYRCNLDCPFCSTKAGGFFNKDDDMSDDVALAALDILLNNAVTPQPQFFFFGGEPLLKYDLIEKVVQQGRKIESQYKKDVRFVVVTNGVLLNDKMLTFFSKNRVDVQVNLDGTKQIHNSQRYFPGKKGTFDIIMDNIRKISDTDNLHLTIRSHVSPLHVHFNETMEYLEQQKLRDYNVAFTMVMGLDAESDFFWKKEDYEKHTPVFLKFVDRYYKNILEYKDPLIDFFGLKGYYTGGEVKKELFCTAATGRLSTGPKGDVYPCFTMEDQEPFWIGHVDKGISTFHATKFLTLAGEPAIKCDDGASLERLFKFFCPFQNRCFSGKINLVPAVLKDSYQGFSDLTDKMISRIKRLTGANAVITD